MTKAPMYTPLFPYLAAKKNAGLLAEGELVIDNFAGIGGASSGMEAALGRPVDHAINHDPIAVSLHRVNHPHSHHSVEDVWQVDPREITRGQPVALCWFSPTCTDFSKAKGGALLDRGIRGLAWVAVRWAALVKPRVIILENVEEFQGWGPLTPEGRRDPKQKGRTFNSFVNALRYQGYQVEWRELRACDYGTPTSRKRLFLIARRDGLPIIWPEPTHGKPSDPRVQAGLLKPYRTAAECIDWSIPTRSIFSRKKPLVNNTLNRIAQGIRRFVLEAAQPYIVTCNHGGEGFRGQGLDQPFVTITAANEAHGLTQPVLMQLMTYYGAKTALETRGSDLRVPVATQTTENRHALVSAHLMQYNGGKLPPADANYSATSPARTIMASGGPQALVSGALIGIDNASSKSGTWDTERPLTTIVTEARHGLTTAHLTAYYGKEQKQGERRKADHGQAADQPLRTIRTKDMLAPVTTTWAAPLTEAQHARAIEIHALLSHYLGAALDPYSQNGLVVLRVRGVWFVLVDIGMRLLSPPELAKCQGFREDYVLDRTAEGKKISKERQTMGIGNSVCPKMAEVLTRAQLSAVLEEAAD